MAKNSVCLHILLVLLFYSHVVKKRVYFGFWCCMSVELNFLGDRPISHVSYMPPEWRSGLMTWSPTGRRKNGPASSGLEEGLAAGALHGSSCSSDSLWRAEWLQADPSRQMNGVSSDTLMRLASRLCRFRRVMFQRMHDSSTDLIGELQQWDKIGG